MNGASGIPSHNMKKIRVPKKDDVVGVLGHKGIFQVLNWQQGCIPSAAPAVRIAGWASSIWVYRDFYRASGHFRDRRPDQYVREELTASFKDAPSTTASIS